MAFKVNGINVIDDTNVLVYGNIGNPESFMLSGVADMVASQVGTYAFMAEEVIVASSGSTQTVAGYTYGATSSGSVISNAGIRGETGVDINLQALRALNPRSGTWRCMGFTDNRKVYAGGINNRAATVWLRIS